MSLRHREMDDIGGPTQNLNLPGAKGEKGRSEMAWGVPEAWSLIGCEGV